MRSLFDTPEFTNALFFPLRVSSPRPEGARDLFLDVAPGVRLHGRIYDHPEALAAVVHFHGNGEVVADYDGFAERFRAAGALAVCCDYRGYGESSGHPTLREVLADALRWVAEVRVLLDRENRRLPLVVMGRSLGAACAAEVAAAGLPYLAGVVVESGAATLRAVAERRGLHPPAPALSEQDFEDFCPLRKHARARAPLLVLHGDEDDLIPPSEAQLVLDASGATDKEVVFVTGYGHNDVLLADRYWFALAAFLERVAARGRCAVD